MGRRNFRMSGLRESNRRECQKTRYGKYHCLLHWEAPRGPHVNPGGPTVERALSSILALELGPRSMLSAGLKGPMGRHRKAWLCMKKAANRGGLISSRPTPCRWICRSGDSGNHRRGVGAVLQQLSSTVDRDSIRSDMLRKLRRQLLPLRQLRHLPPPHGARLHHGKRHRDRRRRGKRRRDQPQRLFDMRKRRLRSSRYTRYRR